MKEHVRTMKQKHRDALRRFKNEHGRQWKSILHASWESGTYLTLIQSDVGLLQQIRKRWGCVALDNV